MRSLLDDYPRYSWEAHGGFKDKTGDKFTEADLRLFPTLYRDDPVYFVCMKINGAGILDFPNLWCWLCRVYAPPVVAQSNSLDHTVNKDTLADHGITLYLWDQHFRCPIQKLMNMQS